MARGLEFKTVVVASCGARIESSLFFFRSIIPSWVNGLEQSHLFRVQDIY